MSEEISGKIGELSWKISNNTLTISGKGKMPSCFNQYERFYDIKCPWSDYYSDIYTVVIETGVSSIGQSAFCGCKNLTSITIPNGVESIGSRAFENCKNLTSIVIPNSVSSIEESAFYGCNIYINIESDNKTYASKNGALFYRTGQVIWRLNTNGTLIIGGNGDMPNYEIVGEQNTNRPWDYNIDLENTGYNFTETIKAVVIETGVTSIGDRAFENCENLTSIIIPKTVTSIGDSAFVGCKNLVFINVDSENNNYASKDGVLFNKSKDTLICCCKGETHEYIIPSSVIKIGDNAFSDCERLISIIITSSVKSIGDWAFNKCKNLTSITIPNSVTSIGNYVFWNCQNLTSIIIPDSVKSIGYQAFRFCKRLTFIIVDSENNNYASEDGVLFNKSKDILIFCPTGKTDKYIIPNSVRSVEDIAFAWCENLISIIIPNSVINIGASAFWACINLTSITIPNSVTSIGAAALGCCRNLTSIIIPNSVTSIGEGAFENCENLTSIIIPNSVINIGVGAFQRCINLTSIIIPNSIISIGDEAFYDCYKLTSIIIPNSVINIGEKVFQNCKNLTSIILPNSVINIGASAFFGCENLTSITNLNPVPIDIDFDYFNNVFYCVATNKCTLKVPMASVSAYKKAAVWKKFNIVGIDKAEQIEQQTESLKVKENIYCTNCWHESSFNGMNYCPSCGKLIHHDLLFHKIPNEKRDVYINNNGLKIITTKCDQFITEYKWEGGKVKRPLIDKGHIYYQDNGIMDPFFDYSGGDENVGFIDINGNDLFFTKDYLLPFHEGLALLGKGIDWQFIDKEFKTVLSIKGYDRVYDNHCGFIRVAKKGEDGYLRYGYLDKNGNEIIECQFSYAEDFIGKNVVVGSGKGKGVINSNNETIIDLRFEEVYIWEDVIHAYSGAYAYNDFKTESLIFDNKGRLIFKCSKSCYYIGHGFFVEEQSCKLFEIIKNLRCGHIYFEVNEIYLPKEIFNSVQYIEHFDNGFAKISYYVSWKGTLYAYLSMDGDIILSDTEYFPDGYQEGRFSSDGYIITKINGWVLYNSNGTKRRFKTQYSTLGSVSEGLIAFKNEHTGGYIDLNENIIIENNGSKYKNHGKFLNGIAPIQNDKNLIGFINKKNQVVLPFIYDGVYYCDKSNAYLGVINYEHRFRGGEHHVIIPQTNCEITIQEQTITDKQNK